MSEDVFESKEEKEEASVKELVGELAQDYAKYFVIDATKEVFIEAMKHSPLSSTKFVIDISVRRCH